MDEDDSQDELINRSSKNKGRRAAAWTISDNSDEAGSDEDVESQSGDEDEEEEPLDEEDEEDEDEDEEEEEDGDEVEPKEEEGCAGTSADAEVSSDEEAEKCPICLHSFNRQPVATPENCAHYFCLDCILEWSKNANSCPIDRTNFKVIYLRTCFGGKVQKVITIQKPAKQCEQDTVDVDLEETSCEVCGGSDREDRLLLCDGCDAGYHMDCLTPPLDAVPVEEWFCPECEANNRQSRASAAETSDTDSLPSTARLPASRRARSQVGQTRAIARTQHSERVRANVNRHRITQARTQELAPTYLIRSTWLDETINAVVAGLNTAVYVRDLTSRPSSTRRRKSRKVNGRKKSKSKNGKAASTGVKRRKRRVRRTKSRKRLVMKKTPTPRSRIANNLGIVKDKKSSSLPTVYRPSESTLSNMRADIGAASLSIYGDPFDLDPFTDREEEEQTHDSVLFEAKRRGISRSAFRSHQPVARPVSLSRRSVGIPQASSVVEAAPVPDLLGSILSGQSMLLMDSSDVVINRDGSLKASKPMNLTNRIRSGSSRSSSSGDGGPQTSPGEPPDHMDRLGYSEAPLNTHFSQSSSPLYQGSPLNSSGISSSHVPPRGNAFSHELNRPNQRLGPPITNGVRECRDNCSSESKAFSQSHSLKAPTKPMWIDVSVLPRIPKIKRESRVDTSVKNDNNGDKMNGSSNGSSSHVPETGINRLAGDKERRHSVDQQDGRTEGQRSRPDGAGSSSGFSSSFSSSSSSSPAASHTNHQRFSSGSSSSSSVSFRISSSGNSWHSRRLNIAPLTPSRSTPQEQRTKKDEDERRRQLRRDKQKLLASRSKDSHGIYDPFNPTESDSGSSDGESGSINVECSSRFKQEPANLKKKVSSRSRWDLKQVKVETQRPHSEDKPTTTTAQETGTQQVKGTKENATFKKVSIFSHITQSETAVEKDPESDTDESVKHVLESETEDDTQPVEQRLHPIKTEETVTEDPAPEAPAALCDDRASAASNSSAVKKWDVADDRASAASNSSPVKKWDVADDRASAASNSSPVKKWDVADDRASAASNPSAVKKWDVADDRASASSNSSSVKKWDVADDGASASSNSSSVKKWDVVDDGASASSNSSSVKKWDVADDRASASATSNSSPVKKLDVADDGASATSNSSPIKELEKTEIKSESHNNQTKEAISNKGTYKKNAPSKDQQVRSSSTERTKKQGSSNQDRRHVRAEVKQEGSDREKDKAKSSRRSRSKERRTHRASDSSLSKSPEKTSKKSRRSRSRSKDKRRSRSYSTSSSRERSRTKKHKKQSKERNEDKDVKRRSSKDKRRDRSRSKSRSKSRSRSRSRDRRRARSRSRSRSRSRDRRKTESRHQSSRDKVESRSKDGKRHRSRSGSRERKKTKEDLPQVKTQKLAETRRSSDKDKKPLKEKRKEDTCTVKAEKVSKTNKPASTSSVVKKELAELKVEEKPFEVVDKQDKTKKEIKKDKCAALDMFEGSPTDNIIKTEHVDTPITVSEDKCWEDTHNINTEVCKSDQLEPNSPEKKPVVSDCSIDDDILSAAVSTPLHDPPDHSTEGPTNSIKQEAVHQSSDSEDDFNVDVMLDNLDLVKSKFDEPTEAAAKQEKDGKSEGEPAAAGPKSKTQVKRVTWNIEEPVGPQPDKSSSKVALYKLKLKQEGIRRPSASTSSLDLTGTTSDVSKSADLERSSGSDSSQGLWAQGQGDDGDLLKKDTTYIKKLHMQERAIEEVKLAIKPFYQKRDISKDEYKDIVRKAVQKVCHSKSGEINPVKVGNLVKAYVDKYKHARKYKKGDEPGKSQESLSP